MAMTLTGLGHRIRRRLAERGVELTPDQLRDALLEAEQKAVQRYPDGLVPRDTWVELLKESIQRKAC